MLVTQLLKKAFEEASLLPDGEQDSLGQWLLEELESEKAWTDRFARSSDVLAKLAAEALREAEVGSAEELDPDTM